MSKSYTVDDMLGELFHLQDYDMGNLEIYSNNSGKKITGVKLDVDDKTGKVKRVVLLEEVE
jgi:hypothetical protein